MKQYEQKLINTNQMQLCVGLDIKADKIPSRTSISRDQPYTNDSTGVIKYCMDLLTAIHSQTSVRVIKLNLAYFISLTDPILLHGIQQIVNKGDELGMAIILDAKIGDIMRTQTQYSQQYNNLGFDAITVNGYMGKDAVSPCATTSEQACYVLVYTSNPSRCDMETLPLFDPAILVKYTDLLSIGLSKEEAKTQIANMCSKNYHKMAEKVIEWQTLQGSVGAVIGGTVNSTGELPELKEIINMFASRLGYLPPILIPGIGTQGGSVKQVLESIIYTLKDLKWSKEKIVLELHKVSMSSSSQVVYSEDPIKEIVKMETVISSVYNNI